MKTIITIILIALSLLIIGCGSELVACQTGELVEDLSECPPYTEPTEQQPIAEGPRGGAVAQPEPSAPVGIDPEIKELIDKGAGVESVSYWVREGSSKEYVIIWSNGMKRYLPSQGKVLKEGEYDTVYLDLAATTAEGYCEIRKKCEKTGSVGSVSFDTYYIETPFDWNAKIRSAQKVEIERMQKRDVIKTAVNDGDTYYIDAYYGLPLRVIVDGRQITFEEFVFNGPTQDDILFQER